MTAPNTSTCPQCGAGLRCGAVGGDATCWCFSMPRVMSVPNLDATQKPSCLCPACLQQLINIKTNNHDPKNLSVAAD